MMTFLGQLALKTLTAPRDVAALLLSLNFSRDAVYTTLGLAVVLNAFVAGLVLLATGTQALPLALGPGLLAGVFALLLAALIGAITVIGRAMGGRATAMNVALLIAWVQILRAGLQFAVLVLGFVSGGMGAVLAIAGVIVGAWVLVHFIDVAHDFGDPWKAAMVLIFSFVLTALALVAVLAGFDITPQMVANDV
ncbi:YIP1 family protein [Salipiger sp. 1_MG-2023]|uniref:YIP1 family protein n=1 Tax=Salipiger sp. 1_MG-2023 TaxID=3062665 RepID=UPI0026E30AAA|nr:YIP1 family protein [Salipiger sp. 1_MG-2023]MDO6585033.1 YIP1 family protein [Salipiger sp. 1_MG-2023]